jgi:predicted RNase H-like HicB family nuclease
MKYRAMIKKSGDWWIGWLIDLPGVNAQEKSKEELMNSLITGAEVMLKSEVPFEPGVQMETVEVSDPFTAP